MIRAAFPLVLLALAACSSRDNTGTDGSETDFASRVGAGQGAAAAGPAAPVATTAAKGPPPAGASVFAMEKLGDISGVDLGPRAGGCAFSDQGRELIIASGPADRALPGKAVVRIGGQLIELDGPPGGVAAVKAGTTFAGEGFRVEVKPDGKGGAAVTTINGKGEQRTVNGAWVCS